MFVFAFKFSSSSSSFFCSGHAVTNLTGYNCVCAQCLFEKRKEEGDRTQYRNAFLFLVFYSSSSIEYVHSARLIK